MFQRPVMILLLILPLPTLASGVQGSLNTQWQSRYISEGRDNLDGSGFYTASMDLSVSDFAAGVWQGTGIPT
ncbi:hypothetical protein [Alcanivorax sp. DP30]|uniref:hypothetical protein n=1 Tax=Alcanivorax sp. DP30 TaxID=2606217 RepID=UPI001369D207|nr:hypothetical protein [Alcanivorax sp. DP30]MZR62863.1 hypothetical protein [Alcanivorax sp. DP30]